LMELADRVNACLRMAMATTPRLRAAVWKLLEQ